MISETTNMLVENRVEKKLLFSMFLNLYKNPKTMILRDEIFPIGQITKPHGLNGEMAFTTQSSILEDVDIPFVILEPDGLFVPFYIESVRMNTDTTGMIKLERIDSEEQAREFIGQNIYLQNMFLNEMEETEFEVEYFVGFEIIEFAKGNIGKITAVDDSTANMLFVVNHNNEEILIPVADEFITEIDHKKRRIYFTLPEGLLDL